MRLLVLGLSLLFVIASCTKISVEEELPEWKHLTPSNIETELDRVNISADQALLDHMATVPFSDIEIPAKLDYYRNSEQLVANKNGIIEIKGAGSASFDMKPWGIVLDEKLNNNHLELITPKTVACGDHLDQLQSFRFRNSGQDYGKTMIKDLAYSEFALQSGLDLEIKYGKPVHLFFNEEYYGLLNFRTEKNQVAIADLIQADSSDITIIKMDHLNLKLEYKHGDEQLAESLITAIKTQDLNTLQNLVDVDNFLDYIIFQDYIGNMDWPHNNTLLYSNNGEPFRFFVFDLDHAAFRAKDHILPEMEFEDDHLSRMLQVFLEKDDSFEDKIRDRQEVLYAKFSPHLFNQIVDELADNISSDIKYLISRRRAPESTLHWKINLEQMKHDFERTDHHSRKKYDLD